MNIYVFTGLSASGKSTISKEFSKRLGIPRIDLHRIIHVKAEEAGFARGRDWINFVGIETALNETRQHILRAISENRNEKGIVIDEVVDPATLNAIKLECSDDEVRVIYMKTNRHDRTKLMTKRLGVKDCAEIRQAKGERRFIDRQKERAGIREIIGGADIRIWNNGKVSWITESLIQSTSNRERKG